MLDLILVTTGLVFLISVIMSQLANEAKSIDRLTGLSQIAFVLFTSLTFAILIKVVVSYVS